MSFFVDPEFDFKAESVWAEDSLPSLSHQTQVPIARTSLKIELTHRATGRVAQTTLEHFAVENPPDLQNVVQRLILKEFGDTKSAQSIRRQIHQISVTLKPTEDLAADIGNGFLVALQNSTESPASALWRNLLGRMPGPLYRLLREKTAFDLLVYDRKMRELDQPLRLDACIAVVKNTWESTFNLAKLYFDGSCTNDLIEDLRRTHAHTFEGAPWPDRVDFLFNEDDGLFQNALFQASQDGYTALGFLSQRDWSCMLSTLVDEVPMDVPDHGSDEAPHAVSDVQYARHFPGDPS